METSATATGQTASGAAATQRSRARDFTTLEAKLVALYESVLDDVDIDTGTSVLDVGCGPGFFLRLAAQRGATVTGIDAAAPFIEIARERLPDADLTVGEMDELPYEAGSFDVVTRFDAFHFEADPARALAEAGRVGRAGAPVVIATWGRPEHCEAAGYVRALGSLLPPPEAPGPFGLSEEGALEQFAARGGLTPGEPREVLCVWAFPDEDTLLRGLAATGFAVKAAAHVGDARVMEAVLDAVAPYRTIGGGYRIENTFTYIVARI